MAIFLLFLIFHIRDDLGPSRESSSNLEEDEAVRSIVEQIGLKNWPEVSSLMIKNYGVSGRSGKQCRERWHNQLSPQVNKRPWTAEEEKLLFEAHKKHKNRWIDISRLFEGRTDNSIKNHFYSTIRRSLRRICKLLGNKNSTSELRGIKPSILSEIFEYSEMKGDDVTKENEDIISQSKIITEELLNFARSKPDQSLEVSENKKKELQIILEKLSEFSINYSKKKEHESSFKREKESSSACHNQYSSQRDILDSSNFEEAESSHLPKPKRAYHPATITKPRKKNIIIIKESSYDWEEFERRCKFVKQACETMMNESPKQSSSSSSSSSLKGEKSNRNENQKNVDDVINVELPLVFCLEENESAKAETYVTPRSKKNGLDGETGDGEALSKAKSLKMDQTEEMEEIQEMQQMKE